MRGVITSADVLRNLRLIWKEFGSRCAIRCLAAIARPKPRTFLQVAFPVSNMSPQFRSIHESSRSSV